MSRVWTFPKTDAVSCISMNYCTLCILWIIILNRHYVLLHTSATCADFLLQILFSKCGVFLQTHHDHSGIYVYVVSSAWNVSVFLCWKMYWSRFWLIAAHRVCLGNVCGLCEWITLSSPSWATSFSVLRTSVCISHFLMLPTISLPLPFFFLLSPPYQIYFSNGITVAGGARWHRTRFPAL